MADEEFLTTENMARIVREIQLEQKPQRKDTPREAAFREKVAEEIAQAPEGAIVDIPKDFEL